MMLHCMCVVPERHTLLISVFQLSSSSLGRVAWRGGSWRFDASKDRFVNFSPHIERQLRAANCSGWMLFGKVSVRNCQNMPRFMRAVRYRSFRGWVLVSVSFFFSVLRLDSLVWDLPAVVLTFCGSSGFPFDKWIEGWVHYINLWNH